MPHWGRLPRGFTAWRMEGKAGERQQETCVTNSSALKCMGLWVGGWEGPQGLSSRRG